MPRLNRGAVGAIAEYVQERRKVADDRYKQDQDFMNRVAAAGITSGRLEPMIQGGRVVGVQPANTTPFNAAALAPGQTYSQKVAGGTLTSRGPTTPRETDPYLQLQRELAVQNTIQTIEQRNALGPTMAMAEREKAFPRPAWGGIAGPGYVENDPNIIQKMTGVQKRPQAAAVPTVDITPYRNRLTQLQQGGAALAPTAVGQESQVSATPDPITQRIQQLLVQGVSAQTIAQHLREKGIDPAQYGL